MGASRGDKVVEEERKLGGSGGRGEFHIETSILPTKIAADAGSATALW